MTAEQWLNDLEAKAKAALRDINDMGAALEFVGTADPIAALRLVTMVRLLALRASASTCPNGWECQNGAHDCEICNTQYAYQQTEPTP